MILVSRVNAQNDQVLNYKWSLAQNYEAAGQLDKAEPLYRELYLQQSWNFQYFESLNRIYISQKKYNESLQLIESKIKLPPLDPGLYGILGTTYYLMDNLQKANEAWDNGIATNPNSSTTYRIIANAAIENRAFNKAIELLNEGKKKSDDAYIFSIDLANIYAINMNFEKAAAELCELILVHPEQAGLVRSRISSFITRPTAAEQTIKAIKNFADDHKTADVLDLLAFTYQQTGKNDEAFEIVEQVEKNLRGNGTSMFVFAQTLFDQKQFDVSAKAFKYILDNYPKSDFISAARINYAKSIEQSLNQKSDSINAGWKPLIIKQKIFQDKYSEVIQSYNSFIRKEATSAYTAEAYFRVGEIYRTRLFLPESADSVYSIIKNSFSLTFQAAQSNLASGKIACEKKSFPKARNEFSEAINRRPDQGILAEAQYYLARIEFWEGNYLQAINQLKETTRNLSNDFSNDALELNFLINIARKDSLNLLKYANADFLLLQNNLEQAATEFKTLADNDNLFIINQFAKIKLAEIFLSRDNFFSAAQLLKSIIKDENTSIFADKCTFLLGLTYFYGLRDIPKSIETFQKILEKFPNSIYFDRARDELNSIQTKNG